MTDQRFPKQYRLLGAPDFQRVYARRLTASDGVLVVRACENGLPYPRLGLAVSRRVGSAVVRNRWKRQIREAFRSLRLQLPTGLDLVVAPKRAGDPPPGAVAASLRRLAARLERRLAPDEHGGRQG